MDSWPEKEAEARFGEMLERCLIEGPQVVTREGAGTAVLVPAAAWERVKRYASPSLKELLLTDFARYDFPEPERSGLALRPVDFDD